MAKYVRVGREVRQAMQALTPLVEPLSIDEAFLDLSGTQRVHGMSGAPLKSSLRCTIFARVGRYARSLIARRDQSRFSMASSEISLEAVPSVGDISPADWDACANPQAEPLENLDTLSSSTPASDSGTCSRPAYNPFVSHAPDLVGEHARDEQDSECVPVADELAHAAALAR